MLPQLAALINSIWSLKLSTNKVTEKLELAPRPEDIKIMTKLVAGDVFSFPGTEFIPVINADIHTQITQSQLYKAMMPLIRVTERLFSAKNAPDRQLDPPACLVHCMDALTLTASAFQGMDQGRRDAIKPFLHYPELTKVSELNPEWLFGDDLDKRVKDIQENEEGLNDRWTECLLGGINDY